MALGHAPLHRSIRSGALMIFGGALAFIVANIVAQLAYANYSLSTNYISDLGNTGNSPLWYVFSLGIVALGALGFLGILLLWSAFPPGGLRVIGLSLLLIASLAAIVIGFVPENVNGSIHGIASLIVFLFAGLGLVAVGAAMAPQTGWESLRWFTLAMGIVDLASLALFLFTNVGANTYPGLFERLVVAPILLWALVLGVFIARFPVRARGRGHLVPGA